MDQTNPPVRSFMSDSEISWKDGMIPDFTITNNKYMRERTRNHIEGSLGKIVENLVKTWEMESTHKTNLKDWGTISADVYQFSVNGGHKCNASDNIKLGNYNMLLMDSPLYRADNETNESALATFKTAFPGGFAWELLEVISGPPKVSFTWRHWASWTGPYKTIQPTGETVELFGMALAVVNNELKITDLQVFYDPNPFLAKLMGLGLKESEVEGHFLNGGQSREGSRAICPFH